MTLNGFLLILTSVSLSAFGQTSFKIGVDRITLRSAASVADKLLGFAGSPFVLLGLSFYALGTVFWLLALRQLDLSLAYPFVALSIIIVSMIGVFGFGEPISPTKAAGLLIIAFGMFVLSRA
jgi:multidrug transporter EmrE-like cation transporter